MNTSDDMRFSALFTYSLSQNWKFIYTTTVSIFNGITIYDTSFSVDARLDVYECEPCPNKPLHEWFRNNNFVFNCRYNTQSIHNPNEIKL